MVALLGVALTATSFTWREHVLMQSANAAETLIGLDLRDYPGAHTLLDNAPVPHADAADGAGGQERPP